MSKELMVMSFRKNLMYVKVEPKNIWEVLDFANRHGIEVRVGSEDDREAIDAQEQEMDYGEDDVTRDWEEDEGAITLTMKEWE